MKILNCSLKTSIMKNHRKLFIVPIDGKKSRQEAMESIIKTFQSPEDMIDYVSHIKFNDTFHLQGYDFSILASFIKNYFNGRVNIFYDLKLPDTNGTNKNILQNYCNYMVPGDILTVSSICSKRSFKEIRELIPEGVKIALYSLPTDTDKEECQMRRGMLPKVAILNDALNLLDCSFNPFDAIVCSTKEVTFLKKNLPGEIEYITPGIRDFWMESGQQSVDRISGIKAATDAGADYLVLGAQLSKGNEEKGVTACMSRKLSIKEANLSKKLQIIKNDPLQTLINLKGFYQSPVDKTGAFCGPLVAYSGTYKSKEGEKNYVGDSYFNLSVIEDHPQILEYYAKKLAIIIADYSATCLVGIPTGGLKIAQEVGRLLNIPGIGLEKKVLAIKTEDAKEKFELHFRRNRTAISKDDRVILFEDLCNNFSTTEKAVAAVQKIGAEVIAIACVANRSLEYQNNWNSLPIISLIKVPSDQYKQEDLLVYKLIKEGKLSTDPKADWPMLKEAMEKEM